MVAKYKYDPYGRTISSSGPLAAANLYRFSSKEINLTSGMYYFGYRFYNPAIQRWMNRDPLSEAWGANLHCFVANVPTAALDPDGRWFWLPWFLGGFVWAAVMAEDPAVAPGITDPGTGYRKLGPKERLQAGLAGGLLGIATGTVVNKVCGASSRLPATPPPQETPTAPQIFTITVNFPDPGSVPPVSVPLTPVPPARGPLGPPPPTWNRPFPPPEPPQGPLGPWSLN
jgi:RHS repeat-associated protein